MTYIPLHIHTRFSLLDGLIDVEALARFAAEHDISSAAITDHGNMYGVIAFYKACKKHDIKPIIGMEIYVVSDLNTDKASDACHLVLLAKNNEGYTNLMRLATEAALGATVTAIADHEMIARYGRGLIGLSACLSGEIPKAILKDDHEEAQRLVEFYKGALDKFYLEIQPNSIPEQQIVNAALVDLAQATDCPLVVTTDAHYIRAEDADAHDVLLAVQVAKPVSDPNRLRFSVDDFYIMPADEIRARLSSTIDGDVIEEALGNTHEIAKQCNVSIQLDIPDMPAYIPSESEQAQYGEDAKLSTTLLRAMSKQGLMSIGRIGSHEYCERLEMELDVICEGGFAPYFLIVQDIIRWAKRNGIVVGPARGSAAGSLVAYVLDITDVDPIKHNLLFERFLNAERAMSDYDWTFSKAPPEQVASGTTPLDLHYSSFTAQEQAEAEWELKHITRQGMLSYYQGLAEANLCLEHNEPNSFVAYAIGITNKKPATVNHTRLRITRQGSVPDIDVDIEDVERKRVMEYVYERYGREHCTQIGNITTMGARATLRRVAKAFELSQREINNIAFAVPEVQGITIADAYTQSSKLAAYREQYPQLFAYAEAIEGCASTTSVHAAGIAIAPGDITTYTPLHKGRGGVIVSQYDMAAIGDLALKIDLLGLTTLTDIRNILDLTGLDYTFLKQIPLDDPATYELLCEAKTDGIFQLSSMLFKRLLKDVQPANFQELADIVALGRPGPSSMAGAYIKRKQGQEPIKYIHPKMQPILQNTYGIAIYQEQVMMLARELANYTLGQADLLRRAMGKKLPEVMEQERLRFVAGCAQNDIDAEAANAIFDHIAEFASYGFNLSHSVSYAYISYWTAYLKAHYPAEFITASLTREASSGDTDRQANMASYLTQARQMDVAVLTPDINLSGVDFSIEPYGSDGDKKAIRMGLAAINGLGPKAVGEILQKQPFVSFDDFFSRINKRIVSRPRTKALIYAGCFDAFNPNRNELFRTYMMTYIETQSGKAKEKAVAMLESTPATWGTVNRRIHEREVFGFVATDPGIFSVASDGSYIHDLVGVTVDVETITDKYGREMAFMTLDTADSELVRVVVFARLFKRYCRIVRADRLLSVSGRKDGNSLLADEIRRLDG